MWDFQDRPPEISTPKYFALVTTPRTWPCNLYTVLSAVLAIVTRTTWHLEGLNSMSHWLSHTDSLSRSFCSTVPASEPPTVRYTAVSSANKRTCDDNSSGRSFMYTRNRSPGVPQMSLEPTLILHPRGPQFVTGYPGRHRSRIVHFLWSHTDGASKGALSDLLCRKPPRSPAVSGQFACLYSYSLQGPRTTW